MKKLKQIGTLALRAPDGRVVENVPILDKVEVDETGLTEGQREANSIYAEFLAERYVKEILGGT